PGVAAVLGAVQRPALVGLDQRPHAAGARGRGGHADTAAHTLRQAGVVGDLGPCGAAVGGAEQAAAGPTADEAPGRAAHLPGGGGEHAGVVGIHRQVDGARVLAAEEHVLPALATVPGAKDAPLEVGTEGVPERGHVDEVRVPGVDADAGDEARVLQAEVGPAL